MNTVKLRRLRLDLLSYYKIFKHPASFPFSNLCYVYHRPACLRLNTPLIQKPASVSDKTLATLFYR